MLFRSGASLPFLGFFGRMTDRRGGYLLMAVGCVPAGLSLVGVGLLSDSWHDLVWLLALGGVGNAAIQPGANGMLASRVAPGHRGLAFGVKQAAIPMAAMVSGLAVPPAASWAGWRPAFVVAGVAMLVVGCLLARHHDADGATAGPGVPAAVVLRRRPLLMLGIATCLASGAATTLGTYFVLSATRSGMALVTAGSVAAIGGACSVLVRIGLGAVADRGLRSPLRQVALMMLVGAGGYVLLALSVPALLVPGVLIAYGAGWGWAGLLNYGVVQRYPLAAGAATSTTQMGTNIGAMAGSPVFALIAASRGYASAWSAMAALALLGGVVVLRDGRELAAVNNV